MGEGIEFGGNRICGEHDLLVGDLFWEREESWRQADGIEDVAEQVLYCFF